MTCARESEFPLMLQRSLFSSMQEQWTEISEFPGYSVSDRGKVRNDETDRLMTLTVNNRGIINVGLMKNLVQLRRSVTVLVAEAFLPPHPFEAFDTPINLDGDRSNNEVWNLMWRPRWFAIKYHNQFPNQNRGYPKPIVDVETGERYDSSWHAATTLGLLDKQIYVSMLNNTSVWPGRKIFRQTSGANINQDSLRGV